MVNRVKHASIQLENLLLLIGAFLIIGFFSGVVLDVGSRIAGKPIDWLQEASTVVFVWTCLLGAPVVYRRNALYRIDLLPARGGGRIPILLNGITLVFEGLFIWVLLRYGASLALLGMDRVSQPSGMPMILGFAALPVAGLAFSLFYAEKLLLHVQHIHPESDHKQNCQ